MRFDETEQNNPTHQDFIPRKRHGQNVKLGLAFIATLVSLYVFAYVPGFNGHGIAPLCLILILGTLCVYVILRNQQSIDLVMSTEYQNLLFSQGISVGNSFCIFIRRDGSIVYANHGIRELLGTQNIAQSQMLEAVFNAGHVSKAERERVMNSIASATSDKLIFSIRTAEGIEKSYILTLEPLARPSGYLLIRGREYRNDRIDSQQMPHVLRATSPEKLEQLLARTPIGNYTTDATGKFEFVNQAFEKALGYAEGEMLQNKISLSLVLHALSGMTLAEDSYTLADYNGEAVLKGKRGDMIEGLLFQTVIRNSKGTLMGVTGSIVTSSMLDS